MDNETPYQCLANHIGKKIKVELKDSTCYEGLLDKVGNSMHEGIGNLLLKEFKKTGYKEESEWGIIRGNNILFVYL